MIDDAIEIIKKAEATEKAYEELQRDVNRYWKLTYREKWSNNLTVYETNERKELYRKLSKVGVKE